MEKENKIHNVGDKYKLKKDLPTWKAGQEMWIGEDGCLYGTTKEGDVIMVYHVSTLLNFNILKNFDFPISLCKIDFLREKIQKKFPTFKLHNLRHTFATSLIRDKSDIYTISQIMGHSSIKSTLVYLSLATENMKKEIEKIKFDL